MKNTYKLILTTLLFTGLMSCEDEQDLLFVTPPASFEILTPTSGTTLQLPQELGNNPALTLTWSDADFGAPTPITYEIEVAETGTDFLDVIPAGSTTGTNLTWSVSELNGVAISAGLEPFSEGGLDIRIKGYAGATGADAVYSNVITILVTPYSTENPKLYVVGNFLNAGGYGNDWTPGNAVPLSSTGYGNTEFEGYVYFNAASFEYKFLPTNISFDGDFGDDGNFTNALVQEGESNCVGSGVGYYLVKANTTSLTYSIQQTRWAITGSATPLGWPDNGVMDQDMTYNPTVKKWQITLALTAGGNKIKFRANDAWDLNYGDTGADGSLNEGGDDIGVPADGTYLVELDLSNPRAYTYTLTAQ